MPKIDDAALDQLVTLINNTAPPACTSLGCGCSEGPEGRAKRQRDAARRWLIDHERRANPAQIIVGFDGSLGARVGAAVADAIARTTTRRQRCPTCGPPYFYGDDGCRHVDPLVGDWTGEKTAANEAAPHDLALLRARLTELYIRTLQNRNRWAHGNRAIDRARAIAYQSVASDLLRILDQTPHPDGKASA